MLFVVCDQHHDESAAFEAVMNHLNAVFTGLFTLECILKLIAFHFKVSRF